MAVLGETLIFFSRGNSFHTLGSRGLVRPGVYVVRLNSKEKGKKKKRQQTRVKDLCKESRCKDDGAGYDKGRGLGNGDQVICTDVWDVNRMQIIGDGVLEDILYFSPIHFVTRET